MIGSQISKYEIIAQLGVGGMAEVYKAFQPRLNRHVAIKLLHAFLAQEQNNLDRFQREAQGVARLHHPNIIQVYDFDLHDDRLYMVMEYIDGQTLKEMMRGNAEARPAIPLEYCLHLVHEIGQALAYAHERQMVHRDVKPANVMVSQDNRVVLMDFGLVKILSGSDLTASGSLMGTPAYMSPEQCLGEAEDPRLDIYSLGVMLFELVVGRKPFLMDTPIGLIMQHISEPPPFPSSLNPDIPQWLEKVILKALAKEPAKRYQRIEEMLNDLSSGSFHSREVIHLSPAPADPRSESQQNLLKAIAALEEQRATLGDAVVNAGIMPLKKQLADLETTVSDTARRKLVTLLVVEFADAVSISRRCDPEDFPLIFENALKQIDVIFRQFGGVQVEYSGYMITALFGIPLSRENDTERAVHAGLRILQAVKEHESRVREQWPLDHFRARVAVNTGILVIDNRYDASQLLNNPTAHLLASLIKKVPPDSLVVTHQTYRHVRGVFDAQESEEILLDGLTEPIKTLTIVQAKPRAFRILNRGIEGIDIPMIGRKFELQQLHEAYRNLIQDQENQVFTISGDAGIGKSRLLSEFINWVDLQPEHVYFYTGRSTQELQNLPYILMRDIFSYRFEIKDNDPNKVVRQKFEAGIQAVLGADSQGLMKSHFIGQLLGFDFGSSPYLEGVALPDSTSFTENTASENLFSERGDAKQLKNRAQAYLVEFFKTASQTLPVLLILEDIHWADESSLDFLSIFLQTLDNARVLVLVTTRPTLYQRRPHWGEGQSFHRQLALTPLSKRNSQALIASALHKLSDIPPELNQLITDKAEGNPFIIEELVRMLLEDGIINTDANRWTVAQSLLDNLRVPSTLTGIIQARLDSLEPNILADLQKASVIGRVFWDDTLYMLARREKSNADLTKSLKELRSREFIFQRDSSSFHDTNEFTFKHAILRDITYQTILKKARLSYHKQVALWLLDHNDERLNEFTGLVAEHLLLAGEMQEALHYLSQAGEKAAAQYAQTEAINYFSRALEICPEADDPIRYSLLLAREEIYLIIGDPVAQQNDLKQLLNLAEKIDDDTRRAQVQLRHTNYYLRTNQFEMALAAAERVVSLGEKLDSHRIKANGLIVIGQVYFRLNEFEKAKPVLHEASEIAQANHLTRIDAECARWFGGVAIFQGDFDSAKLHCEKALALYKQLGDIRQVGGMLNNLGMVTWRQVNYADAQGYFEESLRIMRQTGDKWGESLGLCNLGQLFHLQNKDALAEQCCTEALALARELDYRPTEGVALTRLGHALLGQEKIEEAKSAYQNGLDILTEIDQTSLAVESRAGVAHSLLRMGRLAEAKDEVEKILQFLANHSVDGITEPYRVYHVAYAVLSKAADDRAETVIKEGYESLMKQVATFKNPQAAKAFLNEVEINRAIVALYQAQY